MKKGKITITITIGLSCFVLVLIIFMQFKVVYQTDISSIDTMREEDLQTELSNWKEKYKETEEAETLERDILFWLCATEESYKETLQTLKKYQEESSSDNSTKKNLEEELENAKLILGLTDVEGPGIIITLNDPENIEEAELDDESTEKRVTASELMILVNYLRDAGAEAISINNQRIVNKTDFAQINDTTYIKINSKRVSVPFEIKAIGDAEYLKGTLIGTGFVDDVIKKMGQRIEFNESKKVTINKYEGSMDFKYIEN